jgi:starvation-inducible DNA-binding protein
MNKRDRRTLARKMRSPLATPTDLEDDAVKDIAAVMNAILADVFALFIKTKNFHWHASGPHFRDTHLLFDEQAEQLFEMTDPVAERVRKLGGVTIRSIGQISRMQRVLDNDSDYVDPTGKDGRWKPAPPTEENFPKGRVLEHGLRFADRLGLRK